MSDPDAQPVADDISVHRAERFRSLGFVSDAAVLLADAKDADGFHIYWGDAAKHLKNGATHRQVLALYL